MSALPIPMRWDGEVMRPLPRFASLADQHFVIGESYLFEEMNERSQVSHRHYFAAIRECWASLPERMGDRFPHPETLRKYALIKAGYRDERSIVASSKAEARRLAAFIKPMDEYAIVWVSEAVVTVYMAKSQSMKAMGKKVFQESKDAVLAVLAGMLDVEPEALKTAKAA